MIELLRIGLALAILRIRFRARTRLPVENKENGEGRL